MPSTYIHLGVLWCISGLLASTIKFFGERELKIITDVWHPLWKEKHRDLL